MPYKRRQRRRKNKKIVPASLRQTGKVLFTRSRYGRLMQPTVGILPKGGLPDKLFTSFTYNDSFTLTDNGTADVAVYRQYRLNSLFDPDYTGTGEQPYMRDQLSAFYSKAVIYGCKVRICVMGSSSTTLPHVVTMRPSISASAPTDANLEIERPRSKKICLSSQQDKGILSTYYRIQDLFGISKATLESDQYVISIGSNPARALYLNVVQSPLPIATSTATESLYYTITMKFYCKLYDYKDQSSS